MTTTLITQIKQDQLAARKARMQGKAALLTTLIGEADTKAKNEGLVALTDDKLIKLIQSFLNNLTDNLSRLEPNSIGAISAQQEIEVLSQYLPKQLSDEELQQRIGEIFAALPDDQRKIGPLMGAIKKQLTAGTFDGAKASVLAKQLVA